MKYTLQDVDNLLSHRPSILMDLSDPYVLARQVCEKVLKGSPYDFDALLLLSRLDLEQGQYRDCIAQLSALSLSNPNDWRLSYYKGQALFRLGDFPKASAAFEAAIGTQSTNDTLKMNGLNAEIISELARTYAFGGAIKEAKEYYGLVIEYAKTQVKYEQNDEKISSTRVHSEKNRNTLPIVYIPIEIKARELPSKLLLAVELTKSGFAVVLTQSWTLLQCDFMELPCGIFLFKTLTSIDAKGAERARLAGHRTIIFDEEAFGRLSHEDVFELNTDPSALAVMDMVLCQGKAQWQILENLFPNYRSKLHLTGSPRQELLQGIGGEREDICTSSEFDESSRYILICLMFGNINPVGRSFATTARTTLELASSSPSSDLRTRLAKTFNEGVYLELNLMRPLKDLIQIVSKEFPNRKIIVRPHPSENHAPWSAIFSDLSNVEIRSDGPLSDWLVNAAMVIYQPGCGSGVEARLASVPALCFFNDIGNQYPRVGLSSEINSRATSKADALKWIKTVLEGQHRWPSHDNDLLQDYFETISNKTPTSLIADKITQLYQQHADNSVSIEQARKQITSFEFPPFTTHEFHRQKFPYTSDTEIRDLAQNLLPGVLEREHLDIQDIGENAFLLQRSS